MKNQKKHWSEYGRVTKSEWFRNLPEMEQNAVRDALEHDTHESAIKLRATLAFVFLAAIWTVASFLWGMVFRFPFITFCGTAFGAFLGVFWAISIEAQQTLQSAKNVQAVAGKTFGLPGIILGVIGLAAWLGRLLFFR